jgi:hypothetical protein
MNVGTGKGILELRKTMNIFDVDLPQKILEPRGFQPN